MSSERYCISRWLRMVAYSTASALIWKGELASKGTKRLGRRRLSRSSRYMTLWTLAVVMYDQKDWNH